LIKRADALLNIVAHVFLANGSGVKTKPGAQNGKSDAGAAGS